MNIDRNRRRFLQTAAGSAVGLVLGVKAFPARAAPQALDVVPLADNVALIQGAGGNVVSIAGAEGCIMVDGGLADYAPQLLEAVEGQTPAGRIAALINTHWHLEHTGANELLGRAGTRIIAHEYTKLWMATEIHVEWEQRTYLPRPPEALPTETILEAGDMMFDGEPIRYGHLPRAHTDGDLYVLLPRSNILIAGDVVAVGHYPIIDYSSGGWLGELTHATARLLELCDADTLIVPGSGPVQRREHLRKQYEMLSTVLERLRTMMREGLSTEEMIAAGATREFDDEWGDPTLFVSNAHHSMIGFFRELRIA